MREIRERGIAILFVEQNVRRSLTGADRRVELADLEMVSRCIDDLRSLFEEGTLAERKSFIRSFVKEIKVTDVEVLLN